MHNSYSILVWGAVSPSNEEKSQKKKKKKKNFVSYFLGERTWQTNFLITWSAYYKSQQACSQEGGVLDPQKADCVGSKN